MEFSTENEGNGGKRRGRPPKNRDQIERETELKMDALRRGPRPSLFETIERGKAQGKRMVRLSRNMVVFTDKSRDELLEVYKNTNNDFSL